MVTTKQLTATDLWNMPANDLQDYELIEGELIPMVPPGGEHGRLQLRIGGRLQAFVEARVLGQAYGEAGFVLDESEHTVLAPDLAFVAQSRLPNEQRGYLHIAPDLAVEIVSPGNSPGEIERKVAAYLRYGTMLVWVIYPDQRQIVAHSPTGAPRVFTERDILTGDTVLPGFSVPVSEIFP